jgi:hypothetical protein
MSKRQHIKYDLLSGVAGRLSDWGGWGALMLREGREPAESWMDPEQNEAEGTAAPMPSTSLSAHQPVRPPGLAAFEVEDIPIRLKVSESKRLSSSEESREYFS